MKAAGETQKKNLLLNTLLVLPANMNERAGLLNLQAVLASIIKVIGLNFIARYSKSE
jgi:hypothetical protein